MWILPLLFLLITATEAFAGKEQYAVFAWPFIGVAIAFVVLVIVNLPKGVFVAGIGIMLLGALLMHRGAQGPEGEVQLSTWLKVKGPGGFLLMVSGLVIAVIALGQGGIAAASEIAAK